MDPRQLPELVRADQGLEWLGVYEDGTVGVQCVRTGSAMALRIEEIAQHPWEYLRQVLLCNRNPWCMNHITRITGYYSLTRVWNSSKLAELQDRHNGRYQLPEGLDAAD